MTLAWSTIENAIHAWAESSTGLQALWSAQQGPRPDTAYVELAATVTPVGRDWVDSSDAAVPAPGAECDSTVRGVRSLELTVQCFGASHRGLTGAIGYLDTMITSARLPSQQELFNTAGWAPAEFDALQNIGGVIGGSTFEPRSRFVCRGFAASELVETSTFIEFVEITNLLTSDTFTIPTP